MKRPELLVRVASGLAACSAHRQISRSEGCAKTTVTRLAERLGRHAILFHARVAREAGPIAEPIVHDHFETFIARQDRALAIGTAVGAESWFVYDIDPAPHRGSGRRPDRNPDSQARLRPNRPYVESIKRTLSGLITKIPVDETLTCIVDGRLDYLVAAKARGIARHVTLRAFPNPQRGPKGSLRSPEAIVRDAAMFPVDQLHQVLRHTCSDHKRETISFGRRLESLIGRAHLIAVWKNFIKRRTERRPVRNTPAMYRGVTDTLWSWQRVLARRLFVGRENPSAIASRIYKKRWTQTLPALALQNAG